MDNYKEHFGLFSALLEKERIYMDPALTFGTVCKWIHADKESLDRYIMEETGYSGDDILKAYRGSIASHFMKKYGIEL